MSVVNLQPICSFYNELVNHGYGLELLTINSMRFLTMYGKKIDTCANISHVNNLLTRKYHFKEYKILSVGFSQV